MVVIYYVASNSDGPRARIGPGYDPGEWTFRGSAQDSSHYKVVQSNELGCQDTLV